MIDKKKLLLGLLSQGVSIISPFIVIFLSAKYLSKDESSVWILFLSTTSLLMLFDFGFSPTIIRYTSYIAAGAQSLTKKGVDGVVLDNMVNYPLLNRFVKDINLVYTLLAIVAAVIFGGGGLLYFKSIVPDSIQKEIFPAWIIFSIGLILNIKYLYFAPLITGLDKISDTYVANVISKGIWVCATVFSLNIHASILWLSVCYVLSVLSGRIILHYFMNYKDNIWLAGHGYGIQTCSTLPFVYSNTWRLGVVSFGGFLINRGTTYLAGVVDSLDAGAQYALSVQMFFSIMAVVNVLMSQLLPMLSRARIAKDKLLLKKASLIIYALTLASFIFIGLSFVFLNEWLLSLFKVNVHFLPQSLLLLLGVVFMLEISHSTCATIITTKNEVPFVAAAIISGVSVIFLSSILSISFSLGIVGLIIGQGLVQLLYNNWKWPLELYKDLRC